MYKFKNTLTGAAFALLTGLATMSGNAIALTPDGETPANEGVCDELQGSTPGLYGLCVAYCEAQDLDTFDKKPPSLKILANYDKKRQAGDPDMPCLQVPCPCWTTEELTAITADNLAFCETSAEADQIKITNTTVILPHRNSASATIASGRERCRYIDSTLKPRVRSFDLTDNVESAQYCFAQVQQHCASIGQ